MKFWTSVSSVCTLSWDEAEFVRHWLVDDDELSVQIGYSIVRFQFDLEAFQPRGEENVQFHAGQSLSRARSSSWK